MIGTYVVILRLLSDGVPESGDGILHWQIARYAPAHPELFFDHWGKPLFTLLAAPFARLGLWGACLFTSICAVLSAMLIDRALSGAHQSIRLLAPVLLFTTPVYLEMVFAGMTEVPFALLALAASVLALQRQPRAALVVASFLPFSRPEWIVHWPVLVAWSLLSGNWRRLPWAFFGSMVYALAGLVVLGDPLWFGKDQLYLEALDIYGSGRWDHFLRLADHMFGWPLLLVLGPAVVLWLIRSRGTQRWELPFLTIVPAMGIFAAHSYAWWSGQHASFGLERVMATSVPLLVLFATYALGACSLGGLFGTGPVHRYAMFIAALVIGSWAFASVQDRVRLPMNRSSTQEMNERMADVLAKHITPQRRLIYTHPYFAWTAGRDPFDPSRALRPWQFHWERQDLGLLDSDLLVWDAHFCPNEGGLLLPRLLNDSMFRCLEVIVPPDDVPTLGGWDYELFLFDRQGAVRTVRVDTLYEMGQRRMWEPADVRWLEGSPSKPPFRIGPDEIPFSGSDLPLGEDDILFDLLHISGAIHAYSPGDPPLCIVVTEENSSGRYRYYQLEIERAAFDFRIRFPRREPVNNVRILFWDRQQEVRELTSFLLIRERWTQH
ncbi:MAG: hypothetical protein JNJ64_15500 [Flavobacteriales bacterium]|nr:hypothetical protein [Flavobacteriales bacterium]